VNQKPLAHHPLEAYYDSIVDEPSTLSWYPVSTWQSLLEKELGSCMSDY
jgi:hypothetical protein